MAAQSQEPARAFFIDLARVALLAIDVRLVALHCPLDVGQFIAAVLDAAVESGQFIVELQFKIAGSAAAPNDERVLFGLVFFGGFAHDGAIFDAPELAIAVPTLQ